MPNWKKVIVSGSDAALNSLNVTTSFTASGLNYPDIDGVDRQVIKTDGLGNLTFGYPEEIIAVVKNVSGGTLLKGIPVHATESGAMGNVVGIIAASASDASTMPATFVLNETLADEAEGEALASGFIQGVNTSGFEVGQVVYVGESGGYTSVKPTGNNLIQNLGIVTKVDATNGSGFVLGAGRANDVPNLPEGKVWVGSSTYSVTSSILTLDEDNSQAQITGSLTVTTSITGSSLQLSNLGATDEILIVGNNNEITSSGVLSIDSTSKYVGINQETPEVTLHMTGEGAQSSQIRMEQYNDTADAPDIRTRKARGTEASPSAPNAGDYLFRQNIERYNGSSFEAMHSQQFDLDDSDATKGVYQLQTNTGGGLVTRYAINSDGNHEFTGSLNMTGSINGEPGVTNNLTASYSITASHALNAGGSTALAFSYFNVSNTSLADNTTYRLGQMTGLQTSINAFAHVPLPAGTITEAYIECYVAGTIPSNENITVNFLSDEGATTDTISSAVNFSTTSRHKNFLITGLSIPINAGGTFIEIDTPAFATNPTAVQFRIGIKLEL